MYNRGVIGCCCDTELPGRAHCCSCCWCWGPSGWATPFTVVILNYQGELTVVPAVVAGDPLAGQHPSLLWYWTIRESSRLFLLLLLGTLWLGNTLHCCDTELSGRDHCCSCCWCWGPSGWAPSFTTSTRRHTFRSSMAHILSKCTIGG